MRYSISHLLAILIFLSTGPLVHAQLADGGRFEIPIQGMKKDEGHAYSVILPDHWLEGDTTGKATRSTLQILENGVPLGPAHAVHANIRSVGKGRFSHWNRHLYFSTSDNTDPRSNGRRYAAVVGEGQIDHSVVANVVSQEGLDLVPIAATDIHARRGHIFECNVPVFFRAVPSDSETMRGSILVLYEDGRPLRWAHALHNDIDKKGEGRYSHLGDIMWFSSSDNSDPRKNGRQYAIGIPPRANHQYVDPYATRIPNLVEDLPAPVLTGVREGAVLSDARPVFRVANADPSLLYYWELDYTETFDSPMLLRSPRVAPIRGGVQPLRVIDRDPTFSPEFRPPYRLGAMAPVNHSARSPQMATILALRLGYGLPAGEAEIREVYEFVRAQFYPMDDVAAAPVLSEIFARDRGFCGSINLVAFELLTRMGYSARRAMVQVPWLEYRYDYGEGAHTSLEVFCNERWSVVDPYLQHFIYRTSFEDLARQNNHQYHAARVGRRDGHEGLTDEQLNLFLCDYAQRRRYDLFDWYTLFEPKNKLDETLPFSGEPATRFDPPRSTIWNSRKVDFYVRVRGIRVPLDDLAMFATGTRTGWRLSDRIRMTPWTVLHFRLDLEAAYGSGLKPPPAGR